MPAHLSVSGVRRGSKDDAPAAASARTGRSIQGGGRAVGKKPCATMGSSRQHNPTSCWLLFRGVDLDFDRWRCRGSGDAGCIPGRVAVGCLLHWWAK